MNKGWETLHLHYKKHGFFAGHKTTFLCGQTGVLWDKKWEERDL